MLHVLEKGEKGAGFRCRNASSSLTSPSLHASCLHKVNDVLVCYLHMEYAQVHICGRKV